MIRRRVLMDAKAVQFFKGVIEAHEGLAQVFSEGGGDLLVAAPVDREVELDALLADLAVELQFTRL